MVTQMKIPLWTILTVHRRLDTRCGIDYGMEQVEIDLALALELASLVPHGVREGRRIFACRSANLATLGQSRAIDVPLEPPPWTYVGEHRDQSRSPVHLGMSVQPRPGGEGEDVRRLLKMNKGCYGPPLH